MSTSIDPEQRLRAAAMPMENPEAASTGPGRLVRSVQIFALVTALLGVTLMSAAFANDDWRPALAGVVVLFAASAAGGCLVMHALLVDRTAFYMLGWLAGWYAGWHGKIPNPENPLLRR